MAWTRLNDYGPTVEDSDIESLQSTVDGQRRGYDFVALTEWAAANTTVPAVEVGSVLEINGSVFEIDTSDIVIGTVPGGATNDLYIKLTVTSGTTVTADWSTTVPTWDTAKGGWFDGSDKFLPFIVDYDGANWNNKREIVSRFNKNFILNANGGFSDLVGEVQLARKVIEIGDWNMDTTNSINVTHGVADFTKIRAIVDVMIRRDDDVVLYSLNRFDSSVPEISGGVSNIQATTISIGRIIGSIFDGTNFNSTSFNRGWIIILYEV